MVSKVTEPHCRSGYEGEVESVKRVERVRMRQACARVCVHVCVCVCVYDMLTNLTPAVKRVSKLREEE